MALKGEHVDNVFLQKLAKFSVDVQKHILRQKTQLKNEGNWSTAALLSEARKHIKTELKINRQVEHSLGSGKMGKTNAGKALLWKDPNLLQQYDDTIKSQLELGIIEEVAEDLIVEEGEVVRYLAHQAVVTPHKETTSVVFDTSAHLSNFSSLNDVLYQGPVILPKINLHHGTANMRLVKTLPTTPLLLALLALFNASVEAVSTPLPSVRAFARRSSKGVELTSFNA
ncbi:hypothetical protein NECAME_10732 [Necator americanus]|uniref:Uncharacterized protein n=1 Tax=Necator americanus TaxID=51031 RepID=W2T7B1_NECAM|nr:hypothetical protein NECAME_10732 [Necator americanus]ETN77900.1 hypothetical protein NECAME_10732 [Necator americanus]